MNIKDLRENCRKYFYCTTISDAEELLDMYIEFFFQTITKNHKEKVSHQLEADAQIILQMMMTKALHLKKALNGIDYKSINGGTLNNITDPTINAILVRNIYETVGMFNLIYSSSKGDERIIIYLLWVHAGLSYRQRFEEVAKSEKGKKKIEEEKVQLTNIVKEIEQVPLFKTLSEKNKRKIKQKIKEKDFLLKFKGKEIEFLSWRELTDVMGIKKGKLNNIYTYFSLYTHPSNTSVQQFADMYQKDDEIYKEFTFFNMQVAYNLFSIFIADYIKLFPSVLKTYEEMPIIKQIVINFHNIIFRGDEYSINDEWKKLG